MSTNGCFNLNLTTLDNQCAAGDVVSSTTKIKIRGSKFKFFVSVFP